MRRGPFVAATFVFAAVLAGEAVGADRAPSAANGRTIYVKVGCYQCHGYQAQGAVSGPRLAPDAKSYEAVASFVRHTAGEMPPYSEKILSDADLADIYAYLQSIPRPPAVDSLPLLKP